MHRRVLRLPSAPAPVSVHEVGSGPAVVLLHGQPGAAATWDPLARRLRETARVIALDRPGWGETAGPAVGLAANATVVRELLDALGLARAILVGHSWGGGVALSLAQSDPGRVAALVLACSIGTRSSVDRLDRLLASAAIGPALTYVAFRTLPRVMPLPVTRRLVPGLGALGPDAMRELVGTLRERRDWRSFVAEQRAMVAEIGALDARLGEIRAPTAVITGDGDFLLAPEAGRELARRIPGARWCEVAGAGHVLPLEAPQAVGDAVLDVLARTTLGAPGG